MPQTSHPPARASASRRIIGLVAAEGWSHTEDSQRTWPALVARGEDLHVRAQREVFPEPGFRLLSSRQVVVETHPQAGRTGNAPIAPNLPLLKELVSTVRGQQ